MHQTMTATADLYKLNTGVFDTVLESLQNDRQFDRPTEKANSVNWIAGHIVSARYGVANMLGVEDKSPWGDLYDMGADVADNSKYPSLDEIKSAWKDISAKLLKGLEDVTEEQLAKEPPWKAPAVEPSIRGLIAFMSFHESYHLGQLGYLRRIQGLDSAFG